MDRRIVAGLLGLALAGPAQSSSGMQLRDPSSTGTVGYTPLDPVTDRLNSTNLKPGRPDPASVPTDPTTSGPPARVPTPPVGPNPVGMTPQPALADTIDEGYPTGGFGWFSRRAAQKATTNRKNQRPTPPRARATGAKVDPAATPSSLAWDEAGPVATTTPVGPLGRPAPFRDQVPDGPRPQATGGPPAATAEGDGVTVLGRPAPFAAEIPRQARPQPSKVAQAAPRPQSGVGQVPRFTPPAAGPAPLIPVTLPGPPPNLSNTPDLQAPQPPAAHPDSSGLPPVPESNVLPLPAAPEAPAGSLPVAPGIAPPDLAPASATSPTLPDAAPVAPEVSGEAAAIAPSPVAAGSTHLAALMPASAVDPAVLQTSVDSTSIRIDKDRDKDRPFASARAAAVGSEVITVHQVETMVVEKYKTLTHGEQVSPDEKREILNTLATMALDRLIDQNLVLQEARKRMKDPKQKEQFNDWANKRWRDEKLPELLRKHGVTNEYELRRKLSDDGQSYAEMMENYRQELLEHDFLFNAVKNKINLDLTRLKTYYNQHLQSFDQPARISWREVEVSVARYPDRAAALHQAEAILARLRKEDFATVAAATSDGPSASQGGLYADMTPGNYGIEPVNAVLGRIAARTISPVIEAPNSFHIVRVESRRRAGPLRFDEVQKKVAEAVFEEGFTTAREEYLSKLRARTLIRVMPMFEQAKALQNQRAANDGQVVPAANR